MLKPEVFTNQVVIAYTAKPYYIYSHSRRAIHTSCGINPNACGLNNLKTLQVEQKLIGETIVTGKYSHKVNQPWKDRSLPKTEVPKFPNNWQAEGTSTIICKIKKRPSVIHCVLYARVNNIGKTVTNTVIWRKDNIYNLPGNFKTLAVIWCSQYSDELTLKSWPALDVS